MDLKGDDSFNNFIVIAGRPKSGKSFMVRDILYHMQPFLNMVVVFTGSKFNNYFQEFIDPKYIHDGARLDKLERLLIIAKDFKERDTGNRFLVIFDDLQDTHWRDPRLKEFINLHRQFRIDVIFVCQYTKALSTNIRSNATMGIIFHQTELAAKEGLFNSFGMGMNKKKWFKLLDEVTKEPHYALVVNKDNKDNPFFKYKASKRDFKFKVNIKEDSKK